MLSALIFDYFGVINSSEWMHESHSVSGSKRPNWCHCERATECLQAWVRFAEDRQSQTTLEKEARVSRQDLAKLNMNGPLIGWMNEHTRDYRFGLLTNAHTSQIMPPLRQAGAEYLFDEVLISSEIGLLKPDVNIYKYAAKMLKTIPQECLFIDDSPYNIQGAQMAGMNGYIYTDFCTFYRDMKHLLPRLTTSSF